MSTQSIKVTQSSGPIANFKTQHRSFLTEIEINHGPAQLLGKFFLRADTAVRRRGIALEFAPIQDLVKVNEKNFATWGNMAQTLDSRHGVIGHDEAYCLLGKDASGEVVAAQAGRLYDLRSRTLKDIADDATLYYGSGPRPNSSISCSMTAPSASKIQGLVVYSGALWVRPDYRGQQLAAFLPRISRAYALAIWGTDYTIAFMSPEISASSLRASYGYKNVEPTYSVFHGGRVIFHGNLAWMPTDTLVEDLFEFSSALSAEID